MKMLDLAVEAIKSGAKDYINKQNWVPGSAVQRLN